MKRKALYAFLDWRRVPVPLGVVALAAVGLWVAWGWVDANLATKQALAANEADLRVVQVQVKSIYDVRIEQLRVQRDRLLRQPQTPQTRADLQDIERELDLARKMRDAQQRK